MPCLVNVEDLLAGEGPLDLVAGLAQGRGALVEVFANDPSADSLAEDAQNPLKPGDADAPNALEVNKRAARAGPGKPISVSGALAR
jgi:hypothetical protein